MSLLGKQGKYFFLSNVGNLKSPVVHHVKFFARNPANWSRPTTINTSISFKASDSIFPLLNIRSASFKKNGLWNFIKDTWLSHKMWNESLSWNTIQPHAVNNFFVMGSFNIFRLVPRRGYATYWRGRRVGGSGGGTRYSKGAFSPQGSGPNKSYIWSKLQTPVIFTTSVFIGSCILTPILFKYTPMSWFNRHPRELVYGLMALNVVGYLMWKAPSLYRYMYRYGLLQMDQSFNKWQMLGSAFSHQEIFHLGMNMFVLYQFGTTLAQVVGSQNFTQMYFSSAAFASLGSIAFPLFVRTFTGIPSLGASGAIFSTVGAFSYIFPKTGLSLFFIPLPVGAWYVFLGSVVWNAAGVVWKFGRFDYAGHLGGSLIGIFYGWFYTRQIRASREKRERQTDVTWSSFF
ncbi:rhomboid-domain-containing protein [Nadsonia fulvescens var. elongata DSM 6958]|uniref:Rhomboid-domain-containing protein n=1 Tax=Nadsonia fulvescens var. elongata DSM 6958 TaxID=857566 RepID=A0A1E3PJP8_9ASCO|nr:rhomboid-domain-containing protein [Nadsonia fulvescens var. elongata DSM 6958]